jgi:hypothetical protein
VFEVENGSLPDVLPTDSQVRGEFAGFVTSLELDAISVV